MTGSTNDRRPYHHGDLRASLVLAGVELARAGGPSAVLLRAVSREAGVSHNAAYRHFADHEDLLAAVSEQCLYRMGELMTSRTRSIRNGDQVARAWAELEAIGRAYVDFARREPGWFRTAFTGASPKSHPGGSLSAPDDRHPLVLLNAKLDALVDVGGLSEHRRTGADVVAWSAVHGLSELLVDGPLRQVPAADVDHLTATVLSSVTRSLRYPPG